MKRGLLLKIASAVVTGIAIVAVLVMKFILNRNVFFDVVLIAAFAILLIFVLMSFDTMVLESSRDIESHLDATVQDIIKSAEIGILTYDEDYVITWMSSLFTRRDLDKRGDKLLFWLPELERLLKIEHGSVDIVINEEKYRVSKKEGANTLIFKDITKEYDLDKKLNEDSYVLGLVDYDNFDETNESDEDVSYINSNIKVPVMDYFKRYNIDFKTLRNNSLLLILNERQYAQLLEDRFSILDIVRSESKKADLSISLSMAFARGSDDFAELDRLAVELLELAQTRGGDQVVSRAIGGEAVFYGGSSEAREKQSKVKVKAIANSFKELISKSSNVIICGHLDADSDCVGSAICVSVIASSLGKPAYIIYKNNSVEPMISDAISKYKDELSARHHFVSENEAYNQMNDDSLVVMVDHHSASQSNGKSLLQEAKRIVILDHHRRRADLDVNPVMVYIEAGSSSACELVAEFLPYLTKRNTLKPVEANMMYLGLIIDTNHFRNRTDERTFEVAKTLREAGADPRLCEKLSHEPYEMVKKRAEIINEVEEYRAGIIISCMETGVYPRSIASQACDSLIQTKATKAAFVICKSDSGESIITARSNGEFNVQTILEKMNGGGHMTAAGLQRNDASPADLKKELITVLDGYFEEEKL